MNVTDFVQHLTQRLPRGWAPYSEAPPRWIFVYAAEPADGFATNCVIEFVTPPVSAAAVADAPAHAVVLSAEPLHEGRASMLLADVHRGTSITQQLVWSPGDDADAAGTIRAVTSSRTERFHEAVDMIDAIRSVIAAPVLEERDS